MLKPLRLYSSYKRRASALIGTLVMVGILALAVGVMLSSSTMAIRGSRDKILYEEAYQAAISGTHIARAWLINPDVAKSMTGESWDSDLENLVTRAKDMNEQIIDDNYSPESSLYGTSRYASAGMDFKSTLADGRKVLYQFDNDRPIASFINDSESKKFTTNIFQQSPTKGDRNYVDMIRITTTGSTPETSASLRETTFIIEARGVAEYAGTRKERTVQQRVLIYPNEPSAPLLSAGESILTKGGMTMVAASHANVHWAPVLASGNINNAFLAPLKNTGTALAPVWTLSTVQGSGKKFNGAGVMTSDSNITDPPLDKWLKWMAGKDGRIIGNAGVGVFDALSGTVTIEDFFSQVANGDFTISDKLTAANLTFGGEYTTPDPDTSMLNPNGIITTNDEGELEGALVQGSSNVDTRIDEFFGQMNYAELKDYAQRHDGYYVFDGTNLYDAAGKPAVLPDMFNDYSTAAGGNSKPYDPLGGTKINDRILFVDSVADKNNTSPENPFTQILDLPQFWKGVIYVNGSVQPNGAGNSAVIKGRTPDEFKAFREDGVSDTHEIQNVLVDGILICQGIAEIGGNAAIYGTLAARDGVGVGGTPSIFYNSANGEGRLKDDDSQNALYRVIAGRLYESGS